MMIHGIDLYRATGSMAAGTMLLLLAAMGAAALRLPSPGAARRSRPPVCGLIFPDEDIPGSSRLWAPRRRSSSEPADAVEDSGGHDGGTWKVGEMESGARFLWREGAGDGKEPVIWLWYESTLESGKPFWYDADGDISLTDPFAAGWGGPYQE
ncbi:hypothetical protein AB1Y20_005063 [Prymnesium parvum]|uniref:Uncharacterized protein n=1 Tax=Prymnesium parvum TaxID=97485 RepID=A0AB34J665_PRYPA